MATQQHTELSPHGRWNDEQVKDYLLHRFTTLQFVVALETSRLTEDHDVNGMDEQVLDDVSRCLVDGIRRGQIELRMFGVEILGVRVGSLTP